ncbi:hypothetical protein TSUD_122910 [Trifolium subterraneum]|uniref:F-box domain-containing protein n=1 Tax=Trifolium subterraneum TaxID=3900 RepID=A0A2Z6MH37_TRISU|nr:hypothetical protein TSUD_122910 [Trifolium subterraneum]
MERVIPNWLELPKDITVNILQRLSTVDIVTRACLVCPLWWNICKDPFMWRTIQMIKLHNSTGELLKICQYAIERSCGCLEDIDIKRFGTDDLLKNIAENGSHLRRLRLVDCGEISDTGLIEAAKQLPLLEELDILFSYFSKDALEVIGHCCPLLKSLKWSNEFNFWYVEVEPFSFIKTMPQLRHLELCSDLLTNDELLAILDECPHLESLDIEACNSLVLCGDVRERCCEQIKNLRLPDDFFCDDDTYFDGLSENSSDYSNMDYEDDYDLGDSDSDSGAITGDDKRGYFYGLLGLLPSPRENSDDSDHSDDDP